MQCFEDQVKGFFDRYCLECRRQAPMLDNSVLPHTLSNGNALPAWPHNRTVCFTSIHPQKETTNTFYMDFTKLRREAATINAWCDSLHIFV